MLFPDAVRPAESEVEDALRKHGAYMGAMLFNAHGEIEFCSDELAGLLGRGAAELKGTVITAILPTLPLKPATPGYNVAAMTMSYVGREQPLDLIARGRLLPVQALVSAIRLDTGPAFLLKLRSAGQPGTQYAGALARKFLSTGKKR